MNISFILPTIGRPTLRRAMDSITSQMQPDDELLIVGTPPGKARAQCLWVPCRPGEDWGARERTEGMALATGRYLAFLDDDDVYLPTARRAMAAAIATTPDRPVLFRMQYADGRVLWQEPALREGNVGTPMILIPNDPTRLGVWSSRYETDFDFLQSMHWPPSSIVWCAEVIAAVRPELTHGR